MHQEECRYLSKEATFSNISIPPPRPVCMLMLHVARLKALEPISDYISFHYLPWSHIGPSSETDTRVDCTLSTNITIFFNRDRTTLVTTLRALPFLHICMCHGAEYSNPGTYP